MMSTYINIENLKKAKFIIAISLFMFFLFSIIFIEIMDEIWVDKQIVAVDTAISNWMANNQEQYDRAFFLFMTSIGGKKILAALAVIMTSGLWLYKRRFDAFLLLVGFGCTGVSVYALKYITDRIRPELAVALHETSPAFPSGHASMSLFLFGFAAYLLSRGIQSKSSSIAVFAVGLVIAGLIGASRVYLNAHWLSDVLGGFAISAAFLSIFIGLRETHKTIFKL